MPLRAFVLVASAVLALVLGACASSQPPPSSDRTTSVDPSKVLGTETSANGPTAPAGEALRFDSATLDADGAALTLKFVGGKAYDPANPCSSHYFGWAHELDGVLQAKIVDDTPAFPQPAAACTAEGHPRVVTIDLERPFTGPRVQDLAGYVHFVRRPAGLAALKVPAGWTIQVERDVEESPTGRWQRSWIRAGVVNPEGSKDRIDLYQAFDGPVTTTGGEEVRAVKINGTGATLYRQAEAGELVLVWTLGQDELALVVNENDFPRERAIQLAASAKLP